jgi:hypothetical protein
MRKTIFSGLTVGLAILFVTTTAYPWNYATHAYIAGKIGKALPLANFNEMYGAMAPDLFNFEFSLMTDLALRRFTHGIPPDAAYYFPYPAPNQDFMQVWNLAGWGLKRSTAYGYISHNDAWGDDFVAHWRAFPTADPTPPTPIPFPIYMPEGYSLQPPGYVICLAATLDAGLAIEGIWTAMGFETDYATRLMFCHNIIEYAGDLALKRHDPLIGRNLILACALRTPEFRSLLKAAFPNAYDSMIDAGEPEYRKMLMQYGLILLMPEQRAINMLAEQLADLAIDYLIFLGFPPEMVEPMKPQLVEFGIGALTASIDICEHADSYLGDSFPSYMQELNQVAIPWVKAQLLAHGVFY